MNEKTWQAIDAMVSDGAREAVEYGLIEVGANGTETVEINNGRVMVTGYFDSRIEIEQARENLLEALRIYGCGPRSLLDLTTRELADRDWLAEWKKHWQPVEVGRYIIAPPWSEAPAARDQIVIRINPGMAFGTGTHETTRLCLKAVDKYFAGGSFLDVGTGTGILAIAAAKLAAAPVVACDIDAEAIAIAKENAQLNDVSDLIQFGVGSVDDITASADFVCANLTAPVIVELLPALLNVTCGRLVLSGILDTQFELVHARLLQSAATVNEIMQDGEWLALVI